MKIICTDNIELELFLEHDIFELSSVLGAESLIVKEKSWDSIWNIKYKLDNSSKLIGHIIFNNIKNSSSIFNVIINPKYSVESNLIIILKEIKNIAFDKMGLIKISTSVLLTDIEYIKSLKKYGFHNSKDDSTNFCLLKISTRQATLDDFNFVFYTKKEALYKYIKKIWGWDDTVQYKWLELCYFPENISILKNGDTDIGLLEICIEQDYIDLVNIEIIKEYRSYGIGTNIIKKVIDNVTTQKRVSLRVFKDNNKAKKLYRRLGFKKFGSSENHDLYEYNIV